MYNPKEQGPCANRDRWRTKQPTRKTRMFMSEKLVRGAD